MESWDSEGYSSVELAGQEKQLNLNSQADGRPHSNKVLLSKTKNIPHWVLQASPKAKSLSQSPIQISHMKCNSVLSGITNTVPGREGSEMEILKP